MRRLLVVLLLVAGIVVFARGQVPCDVFTMQPACYVAMLPGPTENTLELIEITGADTHAPAGSLLLTTVAVDTTLDLGEIVSNALSGKARTVQRDVLYPDGESDEDVATRNRIAMRNSQLEATVAGLTAAGYALDDLTHGAQVIEVDPEGSVTDDQIVADDVIVAVDGTEVDSADEAVTEVQKHAPGDEVVLTVLRGDERFDVTLVAGENPAEPGRPLLGLLLADYLALPVDVAIDAGNIGGPSAGLMFALTIVELLGSDDLTAGEVIAGTGTITRDGAVGGIGGIQQKIIGATERDPAATVFLVPQGNFDEARGAAVQHDVLLVPVGTLDEALAALDDLRRGDQPAGAVALGP